MFDLLKSLKQDEAAARRRAVDRYRDLLLRGDSASEADRAEIQSLMAELGKTTADVEADLLALDSRQKLKSLVDAEPQRETASREARAAHAEFAAQVEAHVKSLRAKLEAKLLSMNEQERLYHAARRAIPMLTNLERANWELFGLAKPETGPRPFGPGNPYVPPTTAGGT
ncbi:MAG: hypothetical protein ABSB74_10250 [Tepidisphaeraceae bacterium]